MTSEMLGIYAGSILSLVFSYVPGLNEKYNVLDGTAKRLIMLLLLALAVAGIFAVACLGLAGDFGLSATCDKSGVLELVKLFVAAVIANQATYSISPTK